MKKIIDGKKYDTRTAKAIGYYSNGLSDRDFHHVNETLYLKKTGEFFLAGDGGPLTKYATRCGDMWSGSCNIFPLTRCEAKEWVETYLDADTYEELFGVVDEGFQEKFYANGDRIYWIGHNTDADSGDQYVTILIDEEAVKDAYSTNAEDFFDTLQFKCKTHFTDYGDDDFESIERDFGLHEPIAEGLTPESVITILHYFLMRK